MFFISEIGIQTDLITSQIVKPTSHTDFVPKSNDNQTLKHPFSPGAKPGHFIYFELDISRKTVNCLDTSSASFDSSPFFSEPAMRKVMSFILKAVHFDKNSNMSSSRGLRQSVKLCQTNYAQLSNECGPLSIFNVCLSFYHNFDYLKSYTFHDYQTSAYHLKPFACYALYHGKIAAHSIKEY